MKKIKKFLLYCITSLLAISFILAPFPNKTHMSHAADETIVEQPLINDNVLRFVTITTAGKPKENGEQTGEILTADKIKSIDSNGDGTIDTSYIFAKGGKVTLTLQPLEYKYVLDYNASHFYAPTTENIVINKNVITNTFPTTFTYKGTTYSYSKNSEDELIITNPKENTNFSGSALISMSETENTRTITITKSFSWKSGSPSTKFSFIAGNNSVSMGNNKYVLNLELPIVNFGSTGLTSDFVTSFISTGLDADSTPQKSYLLEPGKSFEKLDFKITNNNYTEINPLYFDINHNGFIYYFKLFSKKINGEDLLFVEYSDSVSENNQSIASVINSETGEATTSIKKYKNGTTDFNQFSLEFSKTGRYEISVYDETYLLGLEYNNYYSTSFYIKTSGNSSDLAFDNAYAIMQSYDDTPDEDGNRQYIDYIVSKPTTKINNELSTSESSSGDSDVARRKRLITVTLNTSVEITLKNLSDYFKNDEIIKNFSPTEETPELNVVDFVKITLAGSSNIPVITSYSVSKINEILNKEDNTQKNFTIDCTDDAFYEVIVYQYGVTVDGEGKKTYFRKSNRSYQFTIVKQPKISYTYYLTYNEDTDVEVPDTENGGMKTVHYSKNDPKYDAVENVYETDIYSAVTPYTTETRRYSVNINSDMDIIVKFSETPTDFIANKNIQKTYLNEYKIDYAMQSVKVERTKVMIEGTSNEKKVLALQCFGVGDITVEVTYNSQTKNFVVKSGEILEFEDYAVYNVRITDSMGTTTTASFSYLKPVSVSAIILIVLVGVIVLAVVLFIISSRGKVKTR